MGSVGQLDSTDLLRQQDSQTWFHTQAARSLPLSASAATAASIILQRDRSGGLRSQPPLRLFAQLHLAAHKCAVAPYIFTFTYSILHCT